MNNLKPKTQAGFTIIELMIAISILSIILLITTVVLMNVGALYAKGVNIDTVQNDNRNIIQNIATSIQYSGVQMTGSSTTQFNSIPMSAVCFGDVRFSYVVGFYNTPHTLWKDVMDGQGSCEPLNLDASNPSCSGVQGCLASVAGSGSELVGPHMHLTIMNIQQEPFSNSLYNIQVGLVYGSKDLFVTNKNGDYVCKTSSGQQFCATSTLSTVAMERVNQ